MRVANINSAITALPRLFQNLLDETLEKFGDLDTDVWAKVFYLEKSTVLAKVYLREKEVIIDDSKADFDGKV